MRNISQKQQRVNIKKSKKSIRSKKKNLRSKTKKAKYSKMKGGKSKNKKLRKKKKIYKGGSPQPTRRGSIVNEQSVQELHNSIDRVALERKRSQGSINSLTQALSVKTFTEQAEQADFDKLVEKNIKFNKKEQDRIKLNSKDKLFFRMLYEILKNSRGFLPTKKRPQPPTPQQQELYEEFAPHLPPPPPVRGRPIFKYEDPQSLDFYTNLGEFKANSIPPPVLNEKLIYKLQEIEGLCVMLPPDLVQEIIDYINQNITVVNNITDLREFINRIITEEKVQKKIEIFKQLNTLHNFINEKLEKLGEV